MRKCTNIRNSIIIRNVTLTVRIATSSWSPTTPGAVPRRARAASAFILSCLVSSEVLQGFASTTTRSQS